MTNLAAIAIVKNMLFSMENILKYRKENHDKIQVDEYMLPEALRIVTDLASSKNSTNIIDEITKENRDADKQ